MLASGQTGVWKVASLQGRRRGTAISSDSRQIALGPGRAGLDSLRQCNQI
jgi:hypothetical protein